MLLALENKVVLAVASHDSRYKREALYSDYALWGNSLKNLEYWECFIHTSARMISFLSRVERERIIWEAEHLIFCFLQWLSH